MTTFTNKDKDIEETCAIYAGQKKRASERSNLLVWPKIVNWLARVIKKFAAQLEKYIDVQSSLGGAGWRDYVQSALGQVDLTYHVYSLSVNLRYDSFC